MAERINHKHTLLSLYIKTLHLFCNFTFIRRQKRKNRLFYHYNKFRLITFSEKEIQQGKPNK